MILLSSFQPPGMGAFLKVTMKPENDFKHKYLNRIKKLGAFTESLETNKPGFPDAFIDWGFPSLVEFKWWGLSDLSKPAKNLFTKYQMPWASGYVKRPEYKFNLYVIFASVHQFRVMILTKKSIDSIKTKALDEILFDCVDLSDETFKGFY